MPSGMIIKGIGGFYYVKCDDGIYECKARGIFRKEKLIPLPGDRVCISILDAEKKIGSLDEILPRQSQLVRPAVANIDQIVIVVAVKSPSPDFLLLDKLLITAEHKGLDVIICINKIDLDTDNSKSVITDAYKKTGYKLIAASLKENAGFEELSDVLTDHITVFAGQSGVGKSSILNRIMNSRVMETGEISSKIERGKHTTRHAELVELQSGGYVVDTPGFSSFELADLRFEELELCYPEFNEYLNKCRFTHCSHISEPDCSIRDALDMGLIDKDRYARYIQMYNLLKKNKTYDKAK